MIIERGSTGDNAALIWDESTDSFIAGTTATDGSASSNLTVTEADLKAKTQNQSDNSTKVATTAYVDTALGSLSSNSITDADSDTKIQVEESSDEDIIRFDIAGTEQITLADGVLKPTTDNDIDLGTSSLEFKDGYFDGTLYTDAINLNGTAITSTAAELNILDGVTSTAAELNLLDGSTAGTVVNSKGVIYGGSGEVNASLIVGGESRYKRTKALIEKKNYEETELNINPDFYIKAKDDLYADIEKKELGMMAVGYYSIIESALRAKSSKSFNQHHEYIAKLYSEFSKIASKNDVGWIDSPLNPDEILNPSTVSYTHLRAHET